MVEEAVLDLVRQGMKGLKPPSHYDRVYKEECMFSFTTPESPGGLFVNLKTFQGFAEEFLVLDNEKTGNTLYLHEKWHRVPIPEDTTDGKPDKLALGAPGGFAVGQPKYIIEKDHQLLVMPQKLVIPYPNQDLPTLVSQVVDAIIAHESASVQDTVAVWEEERRVSKYAKDLPQLDTGRKISPNPKDWKCDETGVTENLWLNLSTGFIGSGRQNWDGSGGNGSALRHFEATGKKYPLVVKLGTITPHGADVYSYAPDEDDMVLDPDLDKHLAHWGINMMQMQKTEKTMTELQIDLNMSYEFDKITESGSALKPLAGPGYTGLINLGNSCYMNSVLQVLWTLPDLRKRYVDVAENIFRTAPADPASDLPAQMAKVGVALLEGKTGAPSEPPAASSAMEADGVKAIDEKSNAVRPLGFKTLVGRGHSEFSSGRQQDAAEYLTHLLELITRAEHANSDRLGLAGAPPTAANFKFRLEDRLQCMESARVSYRNSETSLLLLNVPLEAAVNKEEVEQYKERETKRQKLKEEKADAYIGADTDGAGDVIMDEPQERVIPKVPFDACLQRFAATEMVDDFRSAALGGKRTTATKRTRFATFPPYLTVQLQRYFQDRDWTYKKMEVLVDVPDVINLEQLRGSGPQAGEELQPEEPQGPAAQQAVAVPPAPQPDPELVAQLESMGFSQNACKRAALAVNNSGAEAAMEWVLMHIEDPDINDPLPEPQPAGAASAADEAPSAEQLSMITAMGFTDEQATAALKACGGNIERAADWLFSRMDNLDAAVAEVLKPAGAAANAAGAASTAAAGGPALLDGSGKYELVAFISHMGANLACGHYVCHIKKEGRWVIYNDEKVAESEKPPRDLGYLYLFKRIE